MNDVELRNSKSFISLIQTFLANRRENNYEQLVYELGANISIKKNHFIHSHLDNFPETCEDVSDEQDKRYHQDIKVMGKRNQGRWDKKMMADYHWSLK